MMTLAEKGNHQRPTEDDLSSDVRLEEEKEDWADEMFRRKPKEHEHQSNRAGSAMRSGSGEVESEYAHHFRWL